MMCITAMGDTGGMVGTDMTATRVAATAVMTRMTRTTRMTRMTRAARAEMETKYGKVWMTLAAIFARAESSTSLKKSVQTNWSSRKLPASMALMLQRKFKLSRATSPSGSPLPKVPTMRIIPAILGMREFVQRTSIAIP